MLTLPEEMFAEIAPLSAPLGNHFYQYWCALKPKEALSVIQARVLQEIATKRRDVYLVMDGFVRNRDNAAPHHLQFSTQWVREKMLAPYTPRHLPIPPKTFNQWLATGFIQSERKGRPIPDSVAAVGILRMGIKGKKVLPGSQPKDEPPWWCYAQISPESERLCIPVTDIATLPAHTLVWTPWAGASWNPCWMLIGDALGAIRFAGAHSIQGQVQYTLSLRELFVWRPQLSAIYSKGPFAKDEGQMLVRLALVQLAEGRIHS